MPFTFQHPDLVFDLFHREGDPDQVPVAAAKTAVEAVVGAVVGDVEGGEQDQTVAVDRLLDFPGGLPDQRDHFPIFGLQKDGRLLQGKTLEFFGFGDDRLHACPFGTDGVAQQFRDFCIIDKVFHLFPFNSFQAIFIFFRPL